MSLNRKLQTREGEQAPTGVNRSSVTTDLMDDDKVILSCNDFKSIDDMLTFITLMLEYKDDIDYNTYGKLICSTKTVHQEPTKQNENVIQINDSSERVVVTAKKIGVEYKPLSITDLQSFNDVANNNSVYINCGSTDQTNNNYKGYIHYCIKTSVALVIVDNKNKCRQITIPAEKYNDILRIFNVPNNYNYTLRDINIGRFVYICDVLYNRTNYKIGGVFNSNKYDEVEVTAELRPFFSKTRPASSILPEQNHYDKTSYKYINDNLEMIKQDLKITNVDDYNTFDQERYNSIQYIRATQTPQPEGSS